MSALRLARLRCLCGLNGPMAALIAQLAYGEGSE
jgi:hypothetical protein